MSDHLKFEVLVYGVAVLAAAVGLWAELDWSTLAPLLAELR